MKYAEEHPKSNEKKLVAPNVNTETTLYLSSLGYTSEQWQKLTVDNFVYSITLVKPSYPDGGWCEVSQQPTLSYNSEDGILTISPGIYVGHPRNGYMVEGSAVCPLTIYIIE